VLPTAVDGDVITGLAKVSGGESVDGGVAVVDEALIDAVSRVFFQNNGCGSAEGIAGDGVDVGGCVGHLLNACPGEALEHGDVEESVAAVFGNAAASGLPASTANQAGRS